MDASMSRDEFNALPTTGVFAVGDRVLVWGSFGPLPGVVAGIDAGADPVTYTVEHEDRLPSCKSAKAIRPVV